MRRPTPSRGSPPWRPTRSGAGSNSQACAVLPGSHWVVMHVMHVTSGDSVLGRPVDGRNRVRVGREWPEGATPDVVCRVPARPRRRAGIAWSPPGAHDDGPPTTGAGPSTGAPQTVATATTETTAKK